MGSRMGNIILKKMADKRHPTADYDPRFPNTNQTKHCWTNFVDYNICINKKSEDDDSCKRFKYNYKSLCPNEWVDNWQEQVDEKKFPGQILWGVKEGGSSHH